MRHRKAGKKLSRTSSHRLAMFRNMTTSLLEYEKIVTTDAKAKLIRKWADKIISLAKIGTLHARRQALKIVRSKEIVKRVFNEYAERYRNKEGGYTRIIKAGTRIGDGAPLSIVELIPSEEKKVKEKKKKGPAKTPSREERVKAQRKRDAELKAKASAEAKEAVEKEDKETTLPKEEIVENKDGQAGTENKDHS